MRLTVEFFERAPLVWLLLGLLMISGGLYLGLDHPLTILYLVIGLSCSLYGPLLFAFKRRERPAHASSRTLSRDFISAGSTVVMPAPSEDDAEKQRLSEQRTMHASPG